MVTKKTTPPRSKANPKPVSDTVADAKADAAARIDAVPSKITGPSAVTEASTEADTAPSREAGRTKPPRTTAARATKTSTRATNQGVPGTVASPPLAAASTSQPTPNSQKPPAPANRRRKAKSRDTARTALYGVGAIVRHRFYPFRGIVFDIDPQFNNTEEWWQSIPLELRPDKNQPFYHLLAENADTEYVAYVSEQNLLPDRTGEPLRNPKVAEMFVQDENGRFYPVFIQAH